MHSSSLIQCKLFIYNYLIPSDRVHLKIADVGSYDYNGAYRMLFDIGSPGWQYTGIDINPGPNVDRVVSSDPYAHWGMVDDFDVVVSGQCMEHVAQPWLWIKQVSSILKPGGLLWLTAPHTWGYHPYPVDCWRVFPDGLIALFRQGGLIPLEAEVYENDTWGVAVKPDPARPAPTESVDDILARYNWREVETEEIDEDEIIEGS